ncbi:MAG: serine/threonine-protein kinase [Acidobacteriota bacterium]
MATATTTFKRTGGGWLHRAGSDAGIRRGALLGRYTVLEAIGSGGMGHVFAAWDPELRRRVAIKVLHGDLMDSGARERAQGRLRQEAQAAARLSHPNVVAVYDVGTVGDRLFLAMELVEGKTLAEWGRLPRPWREVLAIYRRAGRGLAAAHRAGWVHRDFKPGNVMLADDGQVKILDFGLAKGTGGGLRDTVAAGPGVPAAPAAPASAGATRTGELLGTPRYMSPEQRSGLGVDHRSDQYSFCVALYRSLFDRWPAPQGDEGVGGGQGPRTLSEGQRRPPQLESEVPRRIQRALERGLRTDPAERFPSMDALLVSLEPATPPRRRAGILAAAAVALGTLVFTVSQGFSAAPQAIDCGLSGRHLDGTWGGERRRALEGIFADAGSPSSWGRAESALDAKVLRLRSAFVEACEATHVRGEQSPALLDRQTACLEDRHRSLGALLRLFEAGTPEVLGEAADSVHGLPGVAPCLDRQALADLPPPGEGDRDAVARVRGRLADSLALELAGRYRDALPELESTLGEAQALGYRPLVGEAQLQLARVVGRLGDSAGMKSHLVDAVTVGLATRHRELLAKAYLQLIVVGFLRGEVEEADIFGRMAEATISTLGDRRDLEAERLFFLGMIDIRQKRFAEAADRYDRYLEVKGEPSPLQRVTALINLSEASRGLGDWERARNALKRADLWLPQIPPGRSARHGVGAGWGELYLGTGEVDLAVESLRHSAEGMGRYLGAEHPLVADVLTLLGRALLESGDIDGALEALRRSSAIHRAMPGYEARPAERLWLLGRALWDRDRGEALARVREAVAAGPGDQGAAGEAAAWLRRHGVGGDGT